MMHIHAVYATRIYMTHIHEIYTTHTYMTHIQHAGTRNIQEICQRIRSLYEQLDVQQQQRYVTTTTAVHFVQLGLCLSQIAV